MLKTHGFKLAKIVLWQSGLMLVASVGCGDGRPARVPVSGIVTIDGQPLEFGQVVIHAASHRPAIGKIGPDGRFTLSTYELGDGCVPGSHAVSVSGMEILDPRTVRWHAPKKYQDANTSGLALDVSNATDSAQITLTWDGGKPFTERVQGGGD